MSPDQLREIMRSIAAKADESSRSALEQAVEWCKIEKDSIGVNNEMDESTDPLDAAMFFLELSNELWKQVQLLGGR